MPGKYRYLLLTVLILCAFCARAGAEITVGEDIEPEDITDFYYTYATSVYPPEYLRYRFWREDGEKWFYHESRQGGGWPQTEDDIVSSGTVALTDEDWAAFFDSLRGGTVRERTDPVLDGDSGPWMYLYWSHDEGRLQEFTFGSPAGRADFLDLCSRLARDHVLTRLRFTRGGYMAPVSYEVALRQGAYTLAENEGELIPFDEDLMEELTGIIEGADIASWDGFRGSTPYVLDGESFSLSLTYADGTNVYASGENRFPDGYHDAAGRMWELFERSKTLFIAGTFHYEGEGAGGDFTLTLKPDGTYTFYEGPLSSYLGGGTWSVYYSTVHLTETSGFDLRFTFAADGADLVYLASNSDPFPYVDVPDGARFLRGEDPDKTD